MVLTRIELDHSDSEQIQFHAESNPSHNFRLTLVQQPQTGKAVSATLRARGMKWPIEPPPVLELTSPEKEPSKWLYIHNPNWFCVADLIPVEVARKTNPKKEIKEGSKDNLSGLLASSLHKVKNPDDRNEHGYFVFGDLNVRDPGVYKIEFTLFEMRRYETQVYAAKVDSIISTQFEISNHKTPLQTKDSTKLSKVLSESGVKIRLRKESTKRKQNQFNWSATHTDNFSFGNQRHPAILAPMIGYQPTVPFNGPSTTRSGRQLGEDVTSRLSVQQNEMPQGGMTQNEMPQSGMSQNGMSQNGMLQNEMHQNEMHANMMQANMMQANMMQTNMMHTNMMHTNMMQPNVMYPSVMQPTVMPQNEYDFNLPHHLSSTARLHGGYPTTIPNSMPYQSIQTAPQHTWSGLNPGGLRDDTGPREGTWPS